MILSANTSFSTWWRHQMGTFSALRVLCEGNPPVTTGGFPSQRPVMRSFGVFFDLHLNKRLNKQSRRRWHETPSRSLWRPCNEKGLLTHWDRVVHTLVQVARWLLGVKLIVNWTPGNKFHRFFFFFIDQNTTIFIKENAFANTVWKMSNILSRLQCVKRRMWNDYNLTHCGRVTHICVSKLIIIGSDNGLSPSQHQAIFWNNAGILLIRT